VSNQEKGSALGHYSSRGIAIPWSGALGGGDGALQKIGRPRQPGKIQASPTGAADSTYAGRMSLLMPDYEKERSYDEVGEFVGMPDYKANIENMLTRKLPGPRKLPRGFKLRLNEDSSDGFEDFVYVESLIEATDTDKKKKKPKREASGTAAVAGYTGPMKSPENPRSFYDKMAKSVGGEYLEDPVKSARGRA
jgi:hypothetical protein